MTTLETTSNIIRVGSQSDAPLVAGAIAGQLRETGRATVQAIGPFAVNQAVKALAIAASYVRAEGMTVALAVPEFVDIRIDGVERTAMRFVMTAESEDAS